MDEMLTIFDEQPLIAVAMVAVLMGVVATMVLALRALIQDARPRR